MLNLFRLLFILFAGVIGWKFAPPDSWLYGILGGCCTGLFFVAVEIGFTKRFITIVSIAMFGLVFGFVLSYLFLEALFMLQPLRDLQDEALKNSIQYGVTAIFCYLAVVAIIRTRDDFKFVVPFVEFSREGKRGKPFVLDSSAIIDGRIADVIDLRLLDVPIVVPRFVIEELQKLADSSDKMKRSKGRRGLDILNRVRKNRFADFRIAESPLSQVEDVDSRLVRFAKNVDGRLVTTDFNLGKIAEVQGVETVNLNNLSEALKIPAIPGSVLDVKLVKPGEERGQGVGYLEDGTMVVVEDGYGSVGQKVEVEISRALQTSAGKMLFGILKRGRRDSNPQRPDRQSGTLTN